MAGKTDGGAPGAKPIKNNRTTLTRKVIEPNPTELGDGDLDEVHGGTYRGSVYSITGGAY